MKPDYWKIQRPNKPLFPDLQWSRPENKLAAGKLLVIGGNLHGFAVPAESYGEALAAGVGSCRALLPQAIQKFVGVIIADALYAPSKTTGGGFGQNALADFLDEAAWADGVLLAGDFGRNSETTVLLEKFLAKTSSAVTIANDAADLVASMAHTVNNRENTLLVLDFSQLQRLGMNSKFHRPITTNMDLLHVIDWLHEFGQQTKAHLLIRHLDNAIVVADGQISTTNLDKQNTPSLTKLAAHASVWWLQNPSKPFAAITTSVL